MSALWPNMMQTASLNLAMNANSVLLQARTAWWAKPRLQMQACVPQATTEDVKEDTKEDALKPAWILACRAVESLLENHQNGRQMPLSITLASEFVRYLVLPAQPMLSNLAEKTAYASATFREIYGAIADDWAICLDDVPLHQATLVAAIDRALLAQLQALAQKYHLQLNQVQAYLAAVSKPLKKQVGRNTGSLVLVENNRLLWLDLLAGQYQQISSHPIVGDWQTTLQQQLARQAFLQDSAHKTLWVYAPLHQNSTLKPVTGYDLKRIGIQTADARYPMLEALA